MKCRAAAITPSIMPLSLKSFSNCLPLSHISCSYNLTSMNRCFGSPGNSGSVPVQSQCQGDITQGKKERTHHTPAPVARGRLATILAVAVATSVRSKSSCVHTTIWVVLRLHVMVSTALVLQNRHIDSSFSSPHRRICAYSLPFVHQSLTSASAAPQAEQLVKRGCAVLAVCVTVCIAIIIRTTPTINHSLNEYITVKRR